MMAGTLASAARVQPEQVFANMLAGMLIKPLGGRHVGCRLEQTSAVHVS